MNWTKQDWTKTLISGLVMLNVFLFVNNSKDVEQSNAVLANQINSPSFLPIPTEILGSSSCNNYGEEIEIEDFKKPIPIIWTAKLDLCATACDGASFIRVPENKKYPRFYGDFDNSGQSIIEAIEKATGRDWPGSDVDYTYTIYGDWVGINYDGAFYVLVQNFCVPIINIKKIEIAR